jgi:predicted phage terminase large subunit-like protein
MDSLLERLMPNLTDKETVQEDLKTYSSKPGLWKAVKYRAHNEDFSKILWKDRFSKESLLQIKQGFIEQGLPDVYSQEYLNYPIDESSAYFKRDDFFPMEGEHYQQKFTYYTAVDFAVSTNERADYTVIATVGINSEDKLFVVDIRRGRWDSSDIVKEMFQVQKRYKPDLFIVEQGAIQKAIGPFLYKEMQTTGVYLNLYPMVPTKDKLSRARSFQARLRAGGVYFDKDKAWYPILEDEMVRFPKDKHDDQVDALSWIGLVLDKVQAAPTPQEEMEEQYNNMIDEDQFYIGKNTVTGY